MLMDVRMETLTSLLSCYAPLGLLRSRYPRLSRLLFHGAVSMVQGGIGDVIFAPGDVCYRQLFVEHGVLLYLMEENMTYGDDVERRPVRESTFDVPSFLTETELMLQRANAYKVRASDWLSEGALWLSNWKYCGELVGQTHVTLQAVDAAEFLRVVKQHVEVYRKLCFYASRYLETVTTAEFLT